MEDFIVETEEQSIEDILRKNFYTPDYFITFETPDKIKSFSYDDTPAGIFAIPLRQYLDNMGEFYQYSLVSSKFFILEKKSSKRYISDIASLSDGGYQAYIKMLNQWFMKFPPVRLRYYDVFSKNAVFLIWKNIQDEIYNTSVSLMKIAGADYSRDVLSHMLKTIFSEMFNDIVNNREIKRIFNISKVSQFSLARETVIKYINTFVIPKALDVGGVRDDHFLRKSFTEILEGTVKKNIKSIFFSEIENRVKTEMGLTAILSRTRSSSKGEKLWNAIGELAEKISEHPEFTGKKAKIWSMILSDLGLSGAIDLGNSIISPSQRFNAIFLSTSDFKIIKKIDTRSLTDRIKALFVR